MCCLSTMLKLWLPATVCLCNSQTARGNIVVCRVFFVIYVEVVTTCDCVLVQLTDTSRQYSCLSFMLKLWLPVTVCLCKSQTAPGNIVVCRVLFVIYVEVMSTSDCVLVQLTDTSRQYSCLSCVVCHLCWSCDYLWLCACASHRQLQAI